MQQVRGAREGARSVGPNPWPIVASMAALLLTIGGVMYMHGCTGGGLVRGARTLGSGEQARNAAPTASSAPQRAQASSSATYAAAPSARSAGDSSHRRACARAAPASHTRWGGPPGWHTATHS